MTFICYFVRSESRGLRVVMLKGLALRALLALLNVEEAGTSGRNPRNAKDE